jgi:BirA family transcriptional regulator, biotin operon repressor / biotin---[acetyl-CoA-carboxylase] ligase
LVGVTLSQERLCAALGERPYQYFEQVESTQDVALEWLRAGAESGAVVIADEQLAGRGRQGRSWHTPPGVALALSIILRPPPEALSQMTMLGALSVAGLLDELGAGDRVEVKWPNDVQLSGRKVCGVLPEAVWEGEQLAGVVLGIGLNVRVDFTGTELETLATSIEPALSLRCDRAELAARLLRQLDSWSARLGTTEVFLAWRARLAMLGKQVSVSSGSASITGLAESVDEQGALYVRSSDGQVMRVVAGDIAFDI